jgi:hypothetical protein
MKWMTFILIATLALAAKGDEGLCDANLARNAVAVVRVKLIFAADQGKKFTVYVVHTIRILKNESHRTFADISVLGFRGRPGVPGEECTIYIQRYDPLTDSVSTNIDVGRWMLVGGDATNGVSNVQGMIKQEN